jgi:hypothetical protein
MVSRRRLPYNSNGAVTRTDGYDQSGKHVGYSLYTYNADGTRAKEEVYSVVSATSQTLTQTTTYTYDANKKPKQANVVQYVAPPFTSTATVDYTWQSGRKTREVWTATIGPLTQVSQYDYAYDSNGRRTVTTHSHATLGSKKSTRTYNADGTVQKVVEEADYNNPSGGTITYTFVWENGKEFVNYDDFWLF